jgi:hypothetical protein
MTGLIEAGRGAANAQLAASTSINDATILVFIAASLIFLWPLTP